MSFLLMDVVVIKFLEKVVVGILVGIFVQIVFVLVNHLYRLVRQPIRSGSYRFAVRAIRLIQKRQNMTSSELFNFYEDLEELLGDFIEKYKGLSSRSPAPSRQEFLYEFVIDIIGLAKGLTRTALRRFLGLDEVPRV